MRCATEFMMRIWLPSCKHICSSNLDIRHDSFSALHGDTDNKSHGPLTLAIESASHQCDSRLW